MVPAFAGPTKWMETRKLKAILCVPVICGLLTLGLWPFHAPLNHVSWLRDRNGVELATHGTVWSAGAFETPGDGPCSLEIWFQPAPGTTGGTLLAFSTPQEPIGFRIWEYYNDVIFATPSAHFELAGIFHPGRPTFLTLTAEENETAVYMNGVLLEKAPPFWHFRLSSADLRGTAVIGQSPRNEDSWHGRIYGLALYHARLDAAQVARNFRDWMADRLPHPDPAPFALYRFHERSGNVIHNAVRSGVDLQIPERFAIVHQYHMQPFWKEFRPTMGYVRDMLTNIIGFVPAGFIFYSFVVEIWPRRRAVIAATLIGTCVSLTIEVLQGWLPTRSSGTTDLFTNTLGTYLGVRLFAWNFARNFYDRVLQLLLEQPNR
jgi:hypothetical protein